MAENGPDRLSDVGCREPGHGDLVKERLKKMMIGSIDHGDSRAGMFEMLTEGQSTKARSQHDHFCTCRFHAEEWR